MKIPEIYLATANTVFLVNHHRQIVGFNPAYEKFAAENGLLEFKKSCGVGVSVLDCVPPVLRKFYGHLYDRAFAGEMIEHEYLCHSAECFRRYLMRLLPRQNQTVVAEHSLIVATPHVQILDLIWESARESYLHASGFVAQCCSCRKLRHAQDPQRWDLVRALIASCPVPVTHTLCPVCAENVYPGAYE